jgi:hypothetical protein
MTEYASAFTEVSITYLANCLSRPPRRHQDNRDAKGFVAFERMNGNDGMSYMRPHWLMEVMEQKCHLAHWTNISQWPAK